MSAPAALATMRDLLGEGGVLDGVATRPYLVDDTESRALHGRADLVLRPTNSDEVAAAMSWCYENEVPITPQGGRTGYSGGAVPHGGAVISLERMRDVRSFDPLLWRAEVEAGLTTAEVRRRARENGLMFPPDPGAAEQSQIGGNGATNAGGPHAFKYGATGNWVTGLEAVVPPGKVIRVGGLIRKNVAGYDLKSLLVGSEGTLAIITALSLRFIPAPELALPLIAGYSNLEAGVEALESSFASGITPAAIEYLDSDAVEIVRAAYPGELAPGVRFLLIAEADGTASEAVAGAAELAEALAPAALTLARPRERGEIEALWRWREGVGLAVTATLGGKVSEDIVVPVDRLAEALEGTGEIAAKHGVRSCSWGHAGDGNLHSTFLFSPEHDDERLRALGAADDLNQLAISLGGSISGEHGVGVVKTAHLGDQLDPAGAGRLHRGVKELFDPKGLLNPGKKVV